jgi:rubrerythrin
VQGVGAGDVGKGGIMEELTVEEIIKYAIRVEQEAYQFYKKASRILGGNELKSITDELAEQELGHINQLKMYIKEDTVIEEELSYLLTIDTSLFDRIIAVKDIPLCSTPGDILKIALDREQTTQKNYEMLFQLEKLGDEIRSTFGSLAQKEAFHTNLISEKLAQMKGRC